MLTWCTRSDVITPGQWIRGKIPRFDINSDASLALTNVQSYRRRPFDGQWDAPWVALSRPPFFSALAVWHIGDAWGGHCHFVTDREVVVGAGAQPIRFEGSLAAEMTWRHLTDGDLTWDFERRWAGWTPASGDRLGLSADAFKRSAATRLEAHRRHATRHWCMHLYRAQENTLKPLVTLDNVYFGDFDSFGRFVFTRENGIIYRATPTGGDVKIDDVADLSAMQPESIAAPAWVKTW